MRSGCTSPSSIQPQSPRAINRELRQGPARRVHVVVEKIEIDLVPSTTPAFD